MAANNMDAAMSAVQNAVTVFYSGTSDAQVQKFLSEFQQSNESWFVCDRILQERKNPLTSCFAAQTLRQKILKELKSLPSENYAPLRESIINHLSHTHVAPHDQTAEATLTQLCLAIADLYIQVPQWNDFIAELLNKCTTLEGDRTRMLLTLLRVFPEEIQSIRVGENRRKQIQKELAANFSSVMTYLAQVLNQVGSDVDLMKKVVVCLSAFLQNPSVSTDSLAVPSNPLLSSVFHLIVLLDLPGDLHDAAAECIVSALYRAEDFDTHRALAIALQQGVYQTVDAFNQAVAREELDKLQNFARIYVELGESLLVKIINEPTDITVTNELGSLYTFELLLLVAGHSDYSLIEMTFNLWYRLSEGLFMIEDDDVLEKYRPFVNRYLTALYRHARFDSDDDGVPDPTSEFCEFRSKVMETVKDVVFIVGSDHCVRSMCNLLVHCASNNGSWDEMEAALYIISCTVNNIYPEDEGTMPELLDLVVTLPPTSPPPLLLTVTSLLGGCSEWLEKHPSYVEKVFKWLFALSGDARYAAKVAETMEEIVRKSPEEAARFVPLLLQLVQHLETCPTNGREVEKAITSILRTTSMLLLQLSDVEMRARLTEMCEPVLVNLRRILTSTSLDANAANKENEKSDAWSRLASNPLVWIDRVAAVFREVKPWCKPDNSPAPWLELANQLYGVLAQVLQRNEASVSIVEHTCRAFRFVVRSLGLQSMGFVEPLVQQMISTYPRHPHSCFLYLASILVDEYGQLEHVRPGLLAMLETLANGSFVLLNQENGFRTHPDTVDDLFRLAARFVQRATSCFFMSNISVVLFDCAMMGLSLDHTEGNRSVTKFLVEVFDQITNARKANFVDDGVRAAETLVLSKGPTLVGAALKASMFQVSGALKRDMAEVLLYSKRFNAAQFRIWITATVAQLPRGPLAATDEQLQRFADNVCDAQCDTIRDVNAQIRDLTNLYN